MLVLARAAVVLALAMCMSSAAHATFVSCADSTVQSWLNTSQQATKVQFAGFTVYPMTSRGVAFEGASASLQIMDVWEVSARIRSSGSIACPSTANNIPASLPYLLQAMEFTSSLCEMTTGTRILAPGVEQTYVNVTVFRPEWASFKMVTTLSIVNKSHEIPVPASDNTFNITYNFTHSTETPKFSIRIENWPWVGPEGNASLKLFFGGFMYSKDYDANASFTQRNRPFSVFQIDTPVAKFKTTFLRAFSLDGVDYVDNIDPREDEFFNISANSYYPIPIGIGICHETNPMPRHYSLLEYDPSISALFTGEDFGNPATDSPAAAAKKRLPPVAYAAPVAILVAALIALVLALKLSPRFHDAVMPAGAKLTFEGRPTKATTSNHTTTADPRDTERSSIGSSAPMSSGWVAPSKPTAI